MKRETGTQISAFERLRDLPAIFRAGEVMQQFRWTSKTVSHYLYLWKRRGLVQAFGGHSDIYANLLVDRNPDWEKALLCAMPSAVLIGIDALRRAGWTTQRVQRPTVAVKAGHRVFKTDHFEVIRRSAAWYEAVRDGIVGDSREGLRMLQSAWALADLLNQSAWGACGLRPDDIEWSQISKDDEIEWRRACASFGLPSTGLMSMAESSRSHLPRILPDQSHQAKRASR
jgi:hypothetical protein